MRERSARGASSNRNLVLRRARSGHVNLNQRPGLAEDLFLGEIEGRAGLGLLPEWEEWFGDIQLRAVGEGRVRIETYDVESEINFEGPIQPLVSELAASFQIQEGDLHIIILYRGNRRRRLLVVLPFV